MKLSARVLFYPAAAFNAVVGLPFFLAPIATAQALGMQPVPSDPLFVQMSFGAVLFFGWLYFLAGRDPVRYRINIWHGVTGKLMTVLFVLGYWLTGQINDVLPAVVGGDIVWTTLFLAYLRQTRQ